MKVSFLGAAGTVTGSRYLLDTGSRRVLIDCGMFQGYKQLRLRNWAKPPFDPATVDAIVLTHAHIDHSGYIPRLVQQGFHGKVFCSAATLALCKILLPDAGHLHEDDARFANRHGFSRHRPALPLYTEAEAEQCLKQFKAVRIGQDFEPVGGVTARLSGAGHILGATFARLQAGGLSITFSGDIGRPNDPLMNPPGVPTDTDYLVVESTYGDRRHPAVDPESELGLWLRRTVQRNGVTVIPAFAVGRAQTLLLQIARLKQKGELSDVPVFLDSPMAVDATTLYDAFREQHRLDEAECHRMCSAATIINNSDQSRALDARRGPMIIISASGMATGGRVVHHLKAFVEDSANLILFAGFQAPGTRGAALVAGARTVRFHGREFAVGAEIGQLSAASSHADADELLAWMRQLPGAPRQVFVTHGEPGASDALRARIERELHWPAMVPEYRETVELG